MIFSEYPSKALRCSITTQPLAPWCGERPKRGRPFFGNETLKYKNLTTHMHILCVMIFRQKSCHPKTRTMTQFSVSAKDRLTNIHFSSRFYCCSPTYRAPGSKYMKERLSLVFWTPHGFGNCQIVRINNSIKYKQHSLQTESNLVQDSKTGFGENVKFKSG